MALRNGGLIGAFVLEPDAETGVGVIAASNDVPVAGDEDSTAERGAASEDNRTERVGAVGSDMGAAGRCVELTDWPGASWVEGAGLVVGEAVVGTAAGDATVGRAAAAAAAMDEL